MELILPLLLGLIPAFVASNKGRSFWLWYIYGVCLFIIALPHSIMLSSKDKYLRQNAAENGLVPCPFCKELIHFDAIVCPHCRKDMPADFQEKNNPKPIEVPPDHKGPNPNMKGQIEWAKNHPEENKK